MNLCKISACFITASALAALAAGCSTHSNEMGTSRFQHDFGKVIPPGAMPDPPGEHVRRFQAVQRTNAMAQEYVIFNHEWYMGGRTLGPYGEHHLRHMITRLAAVPYPVIIQPTPDAELNA